MSLYEEGTFHWSVLRCPVTRHEQQCEKMRLTGFTCRRGRTWWSSSSTSYNRGDRTSGWESAATKLGRKSRWWWGGHKKIKIAKQLCIPCCNWQHKPFQRLGCNLSKRMISGKEVITAPAKSLFYPKNKYQHWALFSASPPRLCFMLKIPTPFYFFKPFIQIESFQDGTSTQPYGQNGSAYLTLAQ